MIPMCAKLCYAGMKPFLFGTVLVERDATTDDIFRAVYAELALIVPFTLEPEILDLMPGQLIFVGEED